MTTKQDVIRARDNYLSAASEMQKILRQLDGIIENGKRGVLVVADAAPADNVTQLAEKMTA